MVKVVSSTLLTYTFTSEAVSDSVLKYLSDPLTVKWTVSVKPSPSFALSILLVEYTHTGSTKSTISGVVLEFVGSSTPIDIVFAIFLFPVVSCTTSAGIVTVIGPLYFLYTSESIITCGILLTTNLYFSPTLSALPSPSIS